MKSKKGSMATQQTDTKKGQIIALVLEIFVCIYVLSFCFGDHGKGSEKTVATKNDEPTEQVEQEETAKHEEAKSETYEERHARYVENFINVYNANCSTAPLELVDDFDLQDEDSGHYRVEYRLNAYEGKKGAYCTIGDNASIEILGSRAYIDGDRETVNQAAATIIKLFNPDLSEEALNEIYEDMGNPDEVLYVNSVLSREGINAHYQWGPESTASFFVDGSIPLNE